MKRMWIFVALLTGACAAPPTAPTPAKTAARVPIGYDINVPDPLVAVSLRETNPGGVKLPPVEAQRMWDYTRTYGGSPNVYYGPLGPHCEYPGVGIVVAPVRAASLEVITSADWSILEPGLTYEWVGRFVYTPTPRPGTFVLDPTHSIC